ncbi:response regulator [candidate division KSB1 bacterium]|nr:response regulator [candidate division KSB1 bacterium]
MMTRCMIVDDEPLAINALSTLLKKLENFEITATCEDAVKAFHLLQKTTVDLLFLDIDMPELSGIELLRSLKKPPKVIFVTAYRDYAFDAFELDVVDYLLKPIAFERLLQALDKYYKLKQKDQNLPELTGTSRQEDKKILMVKADRKVLRLLIKDIYYIESMKDYVQIHMNRRTVISKTSLKSLEASLPTCRFLRIHKSFIINIDKVISFSGSGIEIAGRELPVGRYYKAAAMAALR